MQLNASIDQMFNRYGSSKQLELMLPVVALKDFKCRLASHLTFPKTFTPVFLKPAEALAFLILYKHGIIPTNVSTQHIAGQIDRTI